MPTQMTSTEERGYYIDKPVVKQLQRSKKLVMKNNQDRVYVVDGREGLGKSTLAMQLAYEQDNTLSLDNIVFNADDFEKVLRRARPYQAIIFDEAFNGLSSKGALSKENKRLVRIMMECRQRNLFIFIVLPTIFMLEKYVGIFRSQALFHIYSPKVAATRRAFVIYNYHNKKILYLLGKNLMAYNKPRIKKKHWFFGKLPPTIDKDAYDKKKLAAFRNREGDESEFSKYSSQRDYIIKGLNYKFNIPKKDIVDFLESSPLPIKKSYIYKVLETPSIIP